MILSRRGFLSGLGAVAITAPAIVHAGNLMPVKVLRPSVLEMLDDLQTKHLGRFQLVIVPPSVFDDLARFPLRIAGVIPSKLIPIRPDDASA